VKILTLPVKPTEMATGMAVIYGTFEIYSGLMSSPWTVENFGADEKRAGSAWSTALQAGIIAGIMGAGASILVNEWWPLVGTALTTLYFLYKYMTAIRIGKRAGNTGWVAPKGDREDWLWLTELKVRLRHGT
jgi:hypothetical protein